MIGCLRRILPRRKVERRIEYREMTDAQRAAFDAAFRAMDDAFRALGAFSETL